MKAHRSLRNVVLRTRGSVVVDHHESSAGRDRARLARAILVPALLSVTLSAVSLSALAAASPGQGIRSHVLASAHHASARSVLRAHYVAATSCTAGAGPWMYATINRGPWMYATINRGPWMYATINRGPWMYGRPWMYAKVNGSPWTYAVISGGPGCTRAGQFARPCPVSA